MKMYLILVLCLIVSTGMASNSTCCKGDFILTKMNDTGPLLCWNKVDNSSKSVDLSCSKWYALSERFVNISLNAEGLLLLTAGNAEATKDIGTFCIGDYFNTQMQTNLKVAVICDENADKIINEDIKAYCSVVSAVFYFLTAVVYVALPEMRDLHGKSMINFCCCLGVALSLLAFMKIGEFTHMGLCAARGFFLYFFLVTAFFWMNAMSIQTLLNIKHPTQSESGWREFLWYALYAYGLSSVLTIIVAIVNYLPGSHRRPGIGLNHCWFYSMREQWCYLYSVLSIIIAANICVFTYTTVFLWRNTFSSTSVKALKYKCILMLRLFLLMGVPWVLEMVTSLIESNIIIDILDVLNLLQGPIYFLLLVVFRKRVTKAMYNHGWLKCCAGPIERYLAVGDDVEDIIKHTLDVALDNRTAECSNNISQ